MKKGIFCIVFLALFIVVFDAVGTGNSDDDSKNVKGTPAKEKADEQATEAKPNAMTLGKIADRVFDGGKTVSEAKPDDVVVTVNGVKILEKEVAEEVQVRLDSQMARMPEGQQMPDGWEEMMKTRYRRQTVDMLVEKQLISEKLKAKNIQVSGEEIDAEIEKVAGRNNVAMADVPAELKKRGIDINVYREQVQFKVGIDKLITAEMGSDAKVTDEDAKKFYDENQKRYSTPDQVKASHILIKTDNLDEAGKAQAKEKLAGILKQVKEGADFAELAKEHSDCPSGKRGGDLGFFAKERMVPEFSAAAFAMEEGEVSDIVETKFGYHIIKVTGKQAAKTTSFEEAKEEIISNLEMRKKGDFWRGYSQKLKDDATIEYSEREEALRKASAPKPRPQSQPRLQPQPKAQPQAKPSESSGEEKK